MTKRTRKSAALRVKQESATAVINHVGELPGAAFFSATEALSVTEIDEGALYYAARLQEIRRDYEKDNDEVWLRHDLERMGFDSMEIRECVANPAQITNCFYIEKGLSIDACLYAMAGSWARGQTRHTYR
jgi:hypothetical protein